jgi:hypothetical protein
MVASTIISENGKFYIQYITNSCCLDLSGFPIFNIIYIRVCRLTERVHCSRVFIISKDFDFKKFAPELTVRSIQKFQLSLC